MSSSYIPLCGVPLPSLLKRSSYWAGGWSLYPPVTHITNQAVLINISLIIMWDTVHWTRAKSRPKLNPIHEHRDISAWNVHGIQHLTYIGGSLNSDDTTKSPFSPITHPPDHFYYWLHPDILTQVRLIKFKMGFHILCHHRRIVTMTTIIGIKIILGNKS